MTGRGGAREGAGRPAGPPRAGYRPPLTADRLAQVQAYADAHGLSVAVAVDRLLDLGLRAAGD